MEESTNTSALLSPIGIIAVRAVVSFVLRAARKCSPRMPMRYFLSHFGNVDEAAARVI
jgi:hypothetical protein